MEIILDLKFILCHNLCNLGAAGTDLSYSKSSAFHIYFLGYEFPDSIIVITKNNFYVMATAKKCAYFEKDLVGKNSTINVHVLTKGKDEGANKETMNSLVNIIRKGGNKKLGSIYKGDYQGTFIPIWLNCIEQNQLEKVEISNSLGLFFAIKDAGELVNYFFNCLFEVHSTQQTPFCKGFL